jgi:hypothetical protein
MRAFLCYWFVRPILLSRFTAIGRSVRLLDRHLPGWEWEVDLATLEMRTPYRCVLGQLFGSYTHGKRALGIEHLRPPWPRYDFAGNQFLWRLAVKLKQGRTQPPNQQELSHVCPSQPFTTT